MATKRSHRLKWEKCCSVRSTFSFNVTFKLAGIYDTHKISYKFQFQPYRTSLKIALECFKSPFFDLFRDIALSLLTATFPNLQFSVSGIISWTNWILAILYNSTVTCPWDLKSPCLPCLGYNTCSFDRTFKLAGVRDRHKISSSNFAHAVQLVLELLALEC